MNLLRTDITKELDWNVEAVLERYPELTEARFDDVEQQFVSVSLVPYLHKDIQELKKESQVKDLIILILLFVLIASNFIA